MINSPVTQTTRDRFWRHERHSLQAILLVSPSAPAVVTPCPVTNRSRVREQAAVAPGAGCAPAGSQDLQAAPGAAGTALGAHKPTQQALQKGTRTPNERVSSLFPSWQLCRCGYGLLHQTSAAKTPARPLPQPAPTPRDTSSRDAPSGESSRKYAGRFCNYL